jgi:hypothetical protein
MKAQFPLFHASFTHREVTLSVIENYMFSIRKFMDYRNNYQVQKDNHTHAQATLLREERLQY